MNKKKKICLFPGQGSQQVGMGVELFSAFPEQMSMVQEVLDYDLREICEHNPDNKLNQTQYTQPALFVVNALSYMRFEKENNRPDFVLGHSLGEFNALLAAEVFDFRTGLEIVKKRSELMGEVHNGGMVAVLGLSLEEVTQILNTKFPELDIANINSHTQIVISGPKAIIQKSIDIFEDAYASCIQLNVSAPFHSRYMKPLQVEFGKFLKPFYFSEPKIDVISNVDAQSYTKSKISQLLEHQISSPVLWKKCIEYLLNRYEAEYYELGPGKVLTHLLKNLKKCQRYSKV